jgi:hypothetical protein
MQEIQEKIALKSQRAQAQRQEKERVNQLIADMRKQEFILQTKMDLIQKRSVACSWM